MNDTSLITFKAISNFVSELASEFGKKHKPLRLYQRLVSQTTLSHDKAIMKHIDAFRTFCVNNRDAIISKNIGEIKQRKVQYSSRVYVDIKFILRSADAEIKEVIWKHILCISALVDPAGKAKEILKKNMEDGKAGGDETEFLTNIISKVEETVQPDADPMAAVSSIMNSGIFTDLIGGMQNGLQSGNLDIGKLLGAVQGMVGSLSSQAGDDPQTAGAMSMLNNMTSMMGNMAEQSQGDGKVNPPDIKKMMEGMTQMMGQISDSDETKIEEVEEVDPEEKK